MALNRQEIDLIVNAISKGFDKVTGDVKDVGRAVDTAGDNAKSGGLRFTELASALSLAQQGFQVVAGAAKFAYDNISEGANLNLAAAQFDNLAASIGTTSDLLLNEMRAATSGMQSDAELIAGATDIINLGLADTQEQTVRLATAVGTLGLDMQQVVLTFANNSKARLDALGLSVEDVNAKVEELNAQGFDGDAFDEAVLIGLEEKMRLLGDASETTAGQLQMLEADWANLTNSWKQGAAEIAGPVVSAMVNNREIAAAVREEYEAGRISYIQYQRAVSSATGSLADNAEMLAEYGIILDENGRIIEENTERTNEQARAMEISARLTAQARQEAIDYSAALADTRGPNEELNDKILQTNNLLNEEEAALARARGELNLLTGDMGSAAAEGEPVVSLTERLNAQLERLGNSHDWTLNLSVRGIEGVQQAIRAAGGFNANDQPDPLTGLPSQAIGGNPGDPFDPNLGNVAPGGGVVVNNNFNNNESPAAVANQVAEQIGNAR